MKSPNTCKLLHDVDGSIRNTLGKSGWSGQIHERWVVKSNGKLQAFLDSSKKWSDVTKAVDAAVASSTPSPPPTPTPIPAPTPISGHCKGTECNKKGAKMPRFKLKSCQCSAAGNNKPPYKAPPYSKCTHDVTVDYGATNAPEGVTVIGYFASR